MHQKNPKVAEIGKVFVPEYERGHGYLHLYSIYPDYWNVKRWGEAPCLGHVKATSVYWAKYAAFTGKLLPRNDTFGPRPVLVKQERVVPKTMYINNNNRRNNNVHSNKINKV